MRANVIERLGYLISSCAGYERPLQRLALSMSAPTRDIVAVVGGHAQRGLHQIIVPQMWVTHTSYDYTAPIDFVEHPADYPDWSHVFLLHDTMEAGPNADALIRQANPEHKATAVWGGQCNLLLLRADYARACARQILALKDCSKAQAIAAEGQLWRQLPERERGVYGGLHWVDHPTAVYGGAERMVEHYTGVDLVKYKANWGQTSATGRFVVTP